MIQFILARGIRKASRANGKEFNSQKGKEKSLSRRNIAERKTQKHDSPGHVQGQATGLM